MPEEGKTMETKRGTICRKHSYVANGCRCHVICKTCDKVILVSEMPKRKSDTAKIKKKVISAKSRPFF